MTLDILIALIIGILGMTFIGYSFFIFNKIVPKVDYQLNGWNYSYENWFTKWLRANEYTSYSMLPSRAKKAGVYEQFYAMDPWIRRHFLIWISMAFCGVLLMIIAAILEKFVTVPTT